MSWRDMEVAVVLGILGGLALALFAFAINPAAAVALAICLAILAIAWVCLLWPLRFLFDVVLGVGGSQEQGGKPPLPMPKDET